MRNKYVANARGTIGFWGIWSLTVGCMIGSGIFLLPSVLAPYGLFALAGWLITGAGAIAIAIVIGRLAVRSPRSGGPAIFARDAFGDFAGFLAGWSLWVSLVIAIPAVAMAFVGYAGSLIPGIASNIFVQISIAALLIWTLTLIALRGVKEAAMATIILTILKLLPLAVVVGLAALMSSPAELPALEMPEVGIVPALASTALLTMWAFLGLEAGVVATDSVADPKRTLPRAVALGVITVTLVYMSVTVAVMMLVPPEDLAKSEAPFVDSTRALGGSGVALVAVGAMLSTAGALLAVLFVTGHLAYGMAKDGLAPKIFARKHGADVPRSALLLAATLGSGLLLLNMSEGLLGAFTFLLMMSTATALLPYLLCALAELKHSWGNSLAWITLAFIAAMYSLFALVGSGVSVLLWGALLLIAGVPIFLVSRHEREGESF
ncbi:MAG: amino acid permease [Pseudomonadota bacterium]